LAEGLTKWMFEPLALREGAARRSTYRMVEYGCRGGPGPGPSSGSSAVRPEASRDSAVRLWRVDVQMEAGHFARL